MCYEKLKKAVINDCKDGEGCFNPEGCDKHKSKCSHKYCDKFKWVIERAKHYGDKLELNWEDVLNSWEEDRSYWYMNYYQEANQPEIKGSKVKVFDTIDDLHRAIGGKGFRCPCCGGISKNPYECNSGVEIEGKECNWKVYGFLRDMGKGAFFYIKSEMKGENIFMPISWENDK
ncbi:hypothetical protein NSA24_03115 [Clostridioides mangenotii]|uniref:hypothetical protein n=1 Tax=Metaclostridioides mangenotii TaxID=1540 RepID=UPI00214A2CBA|nr:hypothetical protein [Clostridioides mangenotii]MCR1953824.1 hypothetical protein [Clostridioides mangenotii]